MLVSSYEIVFTRSSTVLIERLSAQVADFKNIKL